MKSKRTCGKRRQLQRARADRMTTYPIAITADTRDRLLELGLIKERDLVDKVRLTEALQLFLDLSPKAR